MASEFGPVMLCTGAMAVNVVYDIRKGHDPFVPLLAGGLFTTVCVILADVEPAIGTALAGVYFLSVFLAHGTEIIDVLSTITKETA
jgi:hypothetical protein